MTKHDIAISVRDLSKSYSISHEKKGRRPTFRDAVMDRVRRPFRKVPKETFWALKDVRFDVKKGDVVGIIGRNGAGKSTLLKILSRITKPTNGEIDVYGRVGSLLEVGTGFHPELTGRENIFLNGAILGMRRVEIKRQFDAIVEFAEVEKFLDTPVKRYSSGMYVRLAFAVAAHLNPEILIVDEVLAVGDAEFQRKCLGKMRDVASGGRTILFVSHNISAVSTLCTKSLVLRKGMVMHVGDVESGIEAYHNQSAASAFADFTKNNDYISIASKIVSIAIYDTHQKMTCSLSASNSIRIEIQLGEIGRLSDPRIGIAFNNSRGERVFAVANYLGNSSVGTLQNGSRVSVIFVLPPIIPGPYSIDVGLYSKTQEPIQEIHRALIVDVADSNFLGMTSAIPPEIGSILVRSRWSQSVLIENLN